jgi:hypothetical protein
MKTSRPGRFIPEKIHFYRWTGYINNNNHHHYHHNLYLSRTDRQAASSFKTSLPEYRHIRQYIPQDHNLNIYRHQTL